MLRKRSYVGKKPRRRKFRDLIFFFTAASIIFSMIFYFNYKQTMIDVPDNLPKVYITCQHRINKYNYRDCVIDVDQDSTIAEIKIRGAFNALFDKVGYRLRLYKQTSYLGMRTDDDWQLFAMYLDYPHMRVKLSFDLWRSLELTNPTAILPDSKYVNVFINEDYIGLYLLTEKNDRKLFGLDRGQDNMDSSLIFQLKDFCDLREYKSRTWEQDLPIPDEDTEIMDRILSSLIYFINNSSDSEFFNPNSGIYSIFDKTNLIDFYVYNFFTQHLDFWNKNYFIMRNTYPSKFFLIPWDFDASFGQWHELKYAANLNVEQQARDKNALYDRLLSDDSFRNDCKKRWFELREDLWTENYIMDMLFEMYEDIKDSIKISMAIYDLDDKADSYINYLIQWIPDRIEYCDYYFFEI